MNFIYVIHMLYCNHLITHSSSKRNSSGNDGNKRGRALRARPLLLSLLPLLFLLLLLLLLCVIRWLQYNMWMT